MNDIFQKTLAGNLGLASVISLNSPSTIQLHCNMAKSLRQGLLLVIVKHSCSILGKCCNIEETFTTYFKVVLYCLLIAIVAFFFFRLNRQQRSVCQLCRILLSVCCIRSYFINFNEINRLVVHSYAIAVSIITRVAILLYIHTVQQGVTLGLFSVPMSFNKHKQKMQCDWTAFSHCIP